MAVHPSPMLRVSQKTCSHQWTLTVTCPSPLSVVALLHDTHRTHFNLASAMRVNKEGAESNGLSSELGSKKASTSQKKDALASANFSFNEQRSEYGNQEWNNPNLKEEMNEYNRGDTTTFLYKVYVKFQTAIYGTFRQGLVLDFGREPVLLQRLCVDVIPVDEMKQVERSKNTVISQAQRWCNETAAIVRFIEDKDVLNDKDPAYNEQDNEVLTLYPPPTNMNFVLTQATLEKTVTKANYRSRFHDLLYMEEIAQFDLMGRFNIKTSVLATKSYILMPSTSSMAKVSKQQLPMFVFDLHEFAIHAWCVKIVYIFLLGSVTRVV